MKRLFAAIPLGLVCVLLVLFAFALHRDPSELPSTLIGKPLPGFDLPSLSSGAKHLTSRDVRGRPMLLNVFSSWCTSCVAEHPLLMALKREGVVIAGIDWKDEPADGAKWLEQRGDPYVKSGNDRTGRVGIDLGVTGVPETFVIDGKGRVRLKHIGPIEQDDWSNTIGPLLRRLGAES
jgi:cytochrome c biogenesis protein CcmG/thiol:disulfide interchange protein DsbE